MRSVSVILFLLSPVTCCSSSQAVVTIFTQRSDWQSTVGPHTSITFHGFPKHTLITTQYAQLGVVFPDGNDVIDYNDSFLNDGVGLVSNDFVFGTIHMTFAQPITSIAADFLGTMDIQLFERGQLIYNSPVFFDSSSRFRGLASTTPFDAAVIRDPSNGAVNIDDLYFGPPIPAPGAVGVMALVALARTRRRNCGFRSPFAGES